jgi:uncharacterized membrane protein
MMQSPTRADSRMPPRTALNVAQAVYALHGLAILIGLLGSATVIGSFVGSVPSILAVIMNYLKRGEARGTWLESHFRWQIRTFWYALFWVVAALLLVITVIGIPMALLIFAATTLWVVYRIVRGWLRLQDDRPMYV